MMKTIGEIIGFSLNWITKKPEVTITMDAKAEDLEKLKDKKLSVELKQYRQHRSLDANSYYWVLCGHIADVIGQSVSYTHNLLLRRYGQIELIDGQAVYAVIPDTDEAAAQVDENETVHLKPTAEVKPGKDGKMYRTYMLLRGSHDYDTKEMSRLIDGTISEAKALGIETLTENQRLEMLALYESKYNARQSA